MPDLDPLDFLFSLERLGMKFGLENMARLCEALDHPERAFTSVLIAGTNGKGSVTAMVDAALRAAGHRAARYTSPHLVRVEERFVIDGREVDTAALRAAAGRVQAAVGRLVAQGVLDGPPTFFECTTAAAFELFRSAGVRIAVLEVGLGGRLDSTNVVTPVAAAITSIAFDHQAQLGDTLTAIAREKAGVARPGIPVVCGPLPAEADREIAAACGRAGARMVRAEPAVAIRWPAAPAGGATVVDVRTRRRQLDSARIALAGRHQVANAAVAVALLDELDAAGIAVSDEAVRAGLAEPGWPARLEHFRRAGVDVLLDAAHNPAGAEALASYLGELAWDRVTLVFGAMHDKDIAGMLGPLMPRCARIVCTAPDTPRALAADALAAFARELSAGRARVEAVPRPADALARAVAGGGPVVVAGSIFLIGPLRDILR